MKKYLSLVLGLGLLLTGAVTVFAAPDPVTSPATNVTSTSATFNGINGDTATDPGTEAFWYGLSNQSFTPTASPSLPGDWTGGIYATTFNENPGGLFSYDISGLTPGTTYYYVAWVSVAGTWYPGATQTFVALDPQIITVDTPAPSSAIYGDTFSVAASSDSSLTVAITTNGGCTNVGGLVTMISGVTDCVVYYDQAGNGTYAPATQETETVTAQKLALTLTGITASNKVYDDNTSATVDASLSVLNGVLPSDTVGVDVSLPVGNFLDKNVDLGKTVNISGVTLTGSGDEINYVLTQPTATADITAASLSITAVSDTKLYDGDNLSSAVPVYSGLLGGDALTNLEQTYDNKNAGIGKTLSVSLTYILNDGNSGNNYTVNRIDDLAGVITKRVLNVTRSASDKVYDATVNAAVSFSDDRLGLDDLTLVGTGAFSSAPTFPNKDVGTGKAVIMTSFNPTGADIQNYSYNVSGNSLFANITKATLPTPTISASDKIYDGTNTATATCTVTPLGTDSVTCSVGAATFSDEDVGAGKTVTATGITISGPDAGNYTVVGTATGTASITKKALTVSFTSTDKTYDTLTSAAVVSPTLSGVVAPDSVTVSGGTANFNNANAGTSKPITASPASFTLGGADSGNYTIATVSPTSANINPKSVTVTAGSQSKIYGNTDPVLTYSGVLLGSDTFSGALARVAGENVGTYTINQGTLTAGGNYSITYVPANLTITQKSITVTATAKSKIYGSADPALTYTNTALSFSDTFSGALARVAGENVGTYAINQGTLTAGGNYNISFSSANLTITQKAITVTAAAKSKVYGSADPALTYTNTALSFSDTFSGALARVAGENVGTYAINQGTLTAGGNYNITFVSANLTINTKAITGNFTVSNKFYDGNNTATISGRSLVGVVGLDNVTYTGGVATFNNENVGTTKPVSGTGFGLSGSSASNYTVNATANTTADITPKALTITASALDKVYDGNDTTTTSLSSAGIVSGDDIVVTNTSATFSDKNVANGKTVSTTFTLTGTDTGNYTATASPVLTTANITAKALTITAVAQDKTEDGTTLATVTLSNDALVGDVVTQTFTSANFSDALVGSGKTVTVLGISTAGADAGNYSANTTATTTANINAHATSGSRPTSGGGSGSSVKPKPTVTPTVLGETKFNFTALLKQGSTGNEVAELQKFLTKGGFGVLVADGKFGAKTKAAVIKFQIANGLKGDGVVGPITRALLNK